LPGEILHSASEGIHSFVIVQPFGCVPNHVDGRGMIRAIQEGYPHLQILPLDVDPDTASSISKAMNRAWQEFFDPSHLPARATIGVADLGPGVLIEMVATLGR
jgi:hypothetical protein